MFMTLKIVILVYKSLAIKKLKFKCTSTGRKKHLSGISDKKTTLAMSLT